tara:strand:- start:128 stop:454 length:327 start_codon:yes stop_codon:yes gene_type:complete
MSEDESTIEENEKGPKETRSPKDIPANQAMIMGLADQIKEIRSNTKGLGDMVGSMDARLHNLGVTVDALDKRVEALEEQVALLMPEEESGELDPEQKTLNDVFGSEDE